MMYRAVCAQTLGPPENYRLVERARPAISPHQVRLAVVAAGVSYVDVLIAAGGYQIRPAPPFTPGTECSGVIIELGAETTGLALGDRVAASCGLGGAFAEEAVVESSNVVRLPEGLSHAAACGCYINYQTAFHGLVQRASIQAGETVIVLGAGGGVGTAAIEIGRALGATVIASASSAAKRAAALKHGAAHVVDSTATDWRALIQALTGASGADVVVDPVGGPETERAFRALGWKGRHLAIGFASGAAADLPTHLPLLKGASLIGVDIRRFREQEPEQAQENLQTINRLIRNGVLKPEVERTFPLERFSEAMSEAMERDRLGRIAIITSPEAKDLASTQSFLTD